MATMTGAMANYLLPAARALERAYECAQQQRQTARDGSLKELRGPATSGAGAEGR